MWVSNGTDVSVDVLVDGDSSMLGRQDRVVQLRPGEQKAIRVRALLDKDGMGLRLTGCDYEFAQPPMGRLPSRIHKSVVVGVEVRLGADAVAYLLPLVGAPDSKGRFERERLDDLPLKPVSKTCR